CRFKVIRRCLINVIQAFTADRTDQSLDIWVLPGRSRALVTSVMPIARTRWRNAGPYDLSRFRSDSARHPSISFATMTEDLVPCSKPASERWVFETGRRHSTRPGRTVLLSA